MEGLRKSLIVNMFFLVQKTSCVLQYLQEKKLIIKWNKLDPPILWNSESFGKFKNNVFKFFKPKLSSFFNCDHCKGIRFMTRLRLKNWVIYVSTNSSTISKII